VRSPKLIATGTAKISMTPMIDVVFLLIIFFLVSSHLAQQESQIPLDLPIAESGLDELVDRDTIVVHVLPDGSWKMSGSTVPLEELESNLRSRLLDAERPVQLRIRTDRNVPYERIEPVLGAAAKVGLGDVVFSVIGDRSS
jgi:biopolymer transport protein ExbD